LKDIQQFKATGEFGAALNRVASILCRQGKWDYVEAWVPQESLGPNLGGVMPGSSMAVQASCVEFYNNDAGDPGIPIAAFKKTAMKGTHAVSGPDGTTNTGRAFLEETGMWQEQIAFSCDTRQAAAKAASLNSRMIIPVALNGEVLAVLSFYSRAVRAEDTDMLEHFQHYSAQLLAAGLSEDTVPMLNAENVVPGSFRAESALNQELLGDVYRRVVAHGVFARATVFDEVNWFFNHLGIPAFYFQKFKVEAALPLPFPLSTPSLNPCARMGWRDVDAPCLSPRTYLVISTALSLPRRQRRPRACQSPFSRCPHRPLPGLPSPPIGVSWTLTYLGGDGLRGRW